MGANSHRTEEPMKPDTQTPLTRDHLQRLKKDKLITSDNWVETPFAEWLELELYAAQNDRDRFEESNRQAWEANARLREQLAQARDEALEEVKKFCKDLSDSSYERFPAYAAGAARCAEGIGEMRHAAPAAQAAPSHMAPLTDERFAQVAKFIKYWIGHPEFDAFLNEQLRVIAKEAAAVPSATLPTEKKDG